MSLSLRSLIMSGLLLAAGAQANGIDSVLAHPPFAGYYLCGEHYQGQLPYPGDDLGTDCMAAELVTVEDRTWARVHRGDGRRNEDWFSFGATLHAPCDCEVEKIHINPQLNQPGELGKPPASFIILRHDDGTRFMLAHVAEPRVEVGRRVGYGEAIAVVGNNGYGRSPHVHVGAWNGSSALQIRWDQSRMSDAKREPATTVKP